MDASLLIRTLTQLYSLILVGFLLTRAKIFDAHVNRQLSTFVASVTYPLLLLCSMMEERSGSRREAVLLLAGGFALYSALILFAEGTVRLLRIPADRRAAFACMMVFGNTGFIGAPLARSLYGDAAFYQVSLLHFAFYFYYNTYAVRRLSGTLPGSHRGGLRLKELFSPGFLVTITAVALYLLHFSIPPLIRDTLYLVGSMTTPLSMLVLGASLAMYPFWESAADPWAYLFSLMRLLALPAAAFTIFRLLSIPAYYRDLSVLTLGMPAGAMTLMLALQVNADEHFFNSSIFVSTMLSAFSLPILGALFLT